ncbi:MAG: hypothetical protein KF861_24245, partial [Planctomycetaceae bacterium]|nr:hypothetical protein [Planctomycetaceae bacterium]
VLEPFESEPLISSVRRRQGNGDAIVLQIERGHRTDILVINADREQSIPIGQGDIVAHFRGEIGVLSLRDGNIAHVYALGEGGWRVDEFQLSSRGVVSCPLIAAEPEALLVSAADLDPPSAGSIFRLLTADGWCYPFHVAAAALNSDTTLLRLQTVEGTPLTYDAATEQLRLNSFPQRQHTGPVTIEWLLPAIWPASATPHPTAD